MSWCYLAVRVNFVRIYHSCRFGHQMFAPLFMTQTTSCAGSPSILTSYPMFILNISINMTDISVSKLEWFMCRPPYHAKYQGEKRRKRMFIPSNLHLHSSQCFYNAKTGGLNRGGILPTLCGTRTRLLVHSLAGTKY